MNEYEVTITISVSSVEAHTDLDAIQYVKDMINDVLGEHQLLFSNQSAVDCDEQD